MSDKPRGMTPEPDMDDPAQVATHIAIEALKEAFIGHPFYPRFVVVIEMPQRIAIASTGDDEADTHRMLTLGAASVRSSMTPAEKRKARAQWDHARAGFERRN